MIVGDVIEVQPLADEDEPINDALMRIAPKDATLVIVGGREVKRGKDWPERTFAQSLYTNNRLVGFEEMIHRIGDNYPIEAVELSGRPFDPNSRPRPFNYKYDHYLVYAAIVPGFVAWATDDSPYFANRLYETGFKHIKYLKWG